MTQALNKNRNKILALASVVAVKAATESKKAMKLTLAEQKELIRNKGIVSRVYITRGDEKLNEDNILCDKMSGLLIGEGIYWIEDQFATIPELAELLHPLGIGVATRGSYGTWGWGDDRATFFDSKLTKVGEAQNVMFEEGSRWLDKAVWADKENNRMAWTIAELQQVLIDTGKPKKAAKKPAKKTAKKEPVVTE